ncbi:uncharacterized protein [Paramormyrops kingsleyae]|uniref:uncharacterized protein n=1 Tax=Paramormyrops kingsleyae TaxID=1676925 RepID=UPI003B97134F
MCISLQETMKEQSTRYKIRSLQRRCSVGVGRLKDVIEEHLHHGVSSLDIREKTLAFFTLRRALLLHNGYSRCSRDVLRLSPNPAEDVTPLFYQQ